MISPHDSWGRFPYGEVSFQGHGSSRASYKLQEEGQSVWQGTVQERVDSIAASPRAYLVRRPAKNVISPSQPPPFFSHLLAWKEMIPCSYCTFLIGKKMWQLQCCQKVKMKGVWSCTNRPWLVVRKPAGIRPDGRSCFSRFCQPTVHLTPLHSRHIRPPTSPHRRRPHQKHGDTSRKTVEKHLSATKIPTYPPVNCHITMENHCF